jgi:hypothetical protein
VSDTTDRVAALLREAAEVHHKVYRITDGADDDWATWYADWLVNLSELPDLLARRPVRSELTVQLVALDEAHAADRPDAPWDRFYAEGLVRHFR